MVLYLYPIEAILGMAYCSRTVALCYPGKNWQIRLL